MKFKFLPVLVVLATVIFCGGYMWWKSSEVDQSAPVLNSAILEKNAVIVDELAELSPNDSISTSPSIGSAIPAGYLPPEQYCSGDQACINDPKTAKSPNDYAWLRKHGYPMREEEARYEAASEAQLRKDSGQGNLVAMSALGERLIATGRREEGLDILRKATNQGSIYAYYGISDFFYEGSGKAGSLEYSAAYLRVAYMMGDHEAATLLLSKYGNLSRVELANIDRTAALFYQRINKGRLPSPRPIE